MSIAGPECASQIRHLAENLDLFEFAPGAHTPAEYGKYMIQESGHFEYDPNLDEFYDYERYGLQHMDQESGMFTNRGYIAYQGTACAAPRPPAITKDISTATTCVSSRWPIRTNRLAE